MWGRRRPVAAWSADLAAAVGIALLFTVLVGPLLVGDDPFGGGAGTFFAQIWLYLAAAGVGVLLGYLLLTALGLDHRSQSLKRYAELRATKPHRVVPANPPTPSIPPSPPSLTSAPGSIPPPPRPPPPPRGPDAAAGAAGAATRPYAAAPRSRRGQAGGCGSGRCGGW